tara:strand:- start:43577 stop:44098 length:522 start_codon:yes stop_codon:yes gene_type:complete
MKNEKEVEAVMARLEEYDVRIAAIADGVLSQSGRIGKVSADLARQEHGLSAVVERMDGHEELSKLDGLIAAAPESERYDPQDQKAVLDRATAEKIKAAIVPGFNPITEELPAGTRVKPGFKPMIEKPVRAAEINYCPCGSVMLPSTEWRAGDKHYQLCKSEHTIDMEAFAPKS